MVEDLSEPYRFVFELDRAIREQVISKLESLQIQALVRNSAPNESGIYALYFKEKLVYVGKASRGTTKSKRTLRSRLNEHVGKLENRENLSILDVGLRYLIIESDWFVWAAEFALINYYQPEWNNSGFGSKVPGVGRPGTHRVSKFNLMYPLKPGVFDQIEGEEDDDSEPPAPPMSNL